MTSSLCNLYAYTYIRHIVSKYRYVKIMQDRNLKIYIIYYYASLLIYGPFNKASDPYLLLCQFLSYLGVQYSKIRKIPK